MRQRIPFLDLASEHVLLREQIREAIDRVIESGEFAGGSFVEEFERNFAVYCERRHAIGVGSGTEALWLALLALDVRPGDEVITVPNSFMATAEAISYCGAKPVFVDVEEENCLMDVTKLEAAITGRTRAIVPVHLFGQMADMDPILEIARGHGVPVIEDAAQAHGAEYKGRRAGSIGDAGCFSFYPAKNLGAFGEAGAVVTDNEELQEKIRILRDHGQTKKYHHSVIGWNCRMDGIQGAILNVKLRSLDGNNCLRRLNAAHYAKELEDIEEVRTPGEAAYARHVYHIYAIRVSERDRVMRHLSDRSVACGIHYPVPIHLQKAYRDLGYGPGSFPVAERVARQLLSLPMFPELTTNQVEAVANEVRDAFSCVAAA